jgi:hypothetical protein
MSLNSMLFPPSSPPPASFAAVSPAFSEDFGSGVTGASGRGKTYSPWAIWHPVSFVFNQMHGLVITLKVGFKSPSQITL